jgi:uncharacterized membrane protein
MSLIPGWAPNLHPLIIHFPIALLIAAAMADLVDALFERPPWLGVGAASLYLVGAGATVVAYVTGGQAAATVFVPGMAHPIVEDHRAWALLTVWYVAIVAVVRLSALFAGFPRARAHRVLRVTAALIGVFFLQQTAERGARLVYPHGVGVIAAPGSR